MNSKSLEEFDRLHGYFKLREKQLPQAVRWKLLFIASKIHQRPLRASELSQLRPEDIEQLRNLDSDSLAVIFITLVKTLLLEKKSDEKECEIKYPGFFETWKNGRVRVEGSRLAVICKKETRHYDLSKLTMSTNRKTKRSFDLQFKNHQLLTLKFSSSQLLQEAAALLQQEIDKYKPTSPLEKTSPVRNNNNEFFNLREVSFQDDFHQFSPVLMEDTLQKVEVPVKKEKIEKMQRSREASSEVEEAMVGEKPDGYRIIEETPQILMCVKDSEARLQVTLLVKTSCQLDKVVSYYLQQKEWNTAIASESINELEVNNWQILRIFKSDSIFEKARGTLTNLKVNCSKNRASITEKSVDDGKSREQTMCHLQSTTKFTRCLGVVKITFECMFNGKGYFQMKDSSNMLVKLFQGMKFLENSLKIHQLQKGKSKIFIEMASREELQKRSDPQLFADKLKGLKMEQQEGEVSLKMCQQSAEMPKTDDSLELPLVKLTKTQAMLKLRPINPLSGPTLDYINLVIARQHERYYLTQRFDQKIISKYDNYIPDYALPEMLKRGGEYRITENNQLVFIDEELLQSQKNTLKFILKQIGANILSGKSVLNVSMPVDVFQSRSFLERAAAQLGMLPDFLLSVADDSPLQQMKRVVAFIISLPTLEMLMQKPFNPILGETFQGYVRGIPIYYEQISHHPPISAYYMTCPEFTLYGNLIAFANVSVNSAIGGNEGIMHIRMRNGTHFQCYFPPAEILGLIFGERKFRGSGRGYVLEETHSLFAEFSIEKAKKGLYEREDEVCTPADVLGGIFKVTPEFTAEISSKNTLRKFDGLNKKDIVEKLTSIKGIWFSDIIMDGEVINKGIRIHPVEYQRVVLPSDSNFRQDIMYHKLGDLDQSQRMKEDLEIKQRADRKLREKNAKAMKKRS